MYDSKGTLTSLLKPPSYGTTCVHITERPSIHIATTAWSHQHSSCVTSCIHKEFVFTSRANTLNWCSLSPENEEIFTVSNVGFFHSFLLDSFSFLLIFSLNTSQWNTRPKETVFDNSKRVELRTLIVSSINNYCIIWILESGV